MGGNWQRGNFGSAGSVLKFKLDGVYAVSISVTSHGAVLQGLLLCTLCKNITQRKSIKNQLFKRPS